MATSPQLVRGLLVLVLAPWGGCVGVRPTVVDRHAQLENQIIGRLQQLERELILGSSVRGGEPERASESSSSLAREAADAARRRAFNADDVARFKAAGLLGEGLDGMVKVLRAPGRPTDARWLPELAREENHDRQVLLRRALQLSPELGPDDLALVRHAFVRLVRQTARSGERFEQPDGTWTPIEADR